MSDSVRELANIIHGLRKDVDGLAGGPQLAHSSIEDGAVDEYDADGTLVSRVGQQFDGTHTTVSLSGPIPPTPVSATIESGPLSLTARWNGKFAGAEFSPMDLKQVEVWINTVNDYTTSRAVATIRGELGEQVVVSPLTVEPHYVWLVARSLSGKASEPSVVASGTPNSAADTTALESALDDAEQRLDTAEVWINDATTTLETTFPSRFQTIETDLSEVPTAISTAKQEAVTAAEQYYDAEIVAVNSAITSAQTDANTAIGAAQTAQATADGAIRTHYSITPPWPDGSVREASDLGDLWYNSETDQAHRWNGTTWAIIQDSTIASALGKAEDAYELAGKKSTAYYQATQPVGVAGDIWYDTDDNNKPYFCVSAEPQTWTPVRDGEIADAELRAAQDAKTKADTAYDDAVADAALDATNKANEAERLAKEAAALDATAKMETAESNAAIEAASIAQTKADTAKTEAITEAERLVGEKGKVWIQNTAPATGSEFDLWIDTSLNTEGLPKNQPNKWTGSVWEPVTDNVALSLASAEAAAKASAAETAAINAAAADATAKDEALEAVAANEAARIAGIKAGDALTNAKTYTDDEVVEALTTAASTAQTKADEAERLAKEYADTSIEGAVNLINNTSTSNDVDRWTFTGGGTGTVVTDVFGGMSIPVMSVVTDGNCQVVSDSFAVDASKAYEVRLWLKHPVSADGIKPSMYFGMYVANRTGGSAVSRRVNNANGTTVAPSTNNYFWNDSNPLADVWVEHVGYLLPYGTDPASTVGLGVNVQANVIFEPDNAFAQIRFLNYYNEGVSREVLAAHMTVTEASMESIRLARDSRVAAQAAHDRADDAHELAGTAEGNAQTAITSASNKSTVSRDTTAPAGIGTRDGDIWFQFKDTTWTEVIGQWTWNATTETWNKNTLSHETISSVDIGSLTVAGTATIETAVINQLFSDVVVAKTVTATEAFIGTNAVIENSITAAKIYASEELSAKAGQFLTITTDMIEANSITGTKISGGAIDGMLITGATFQTSGEGAGMKLSSQGFVTYDADGTITTSIPTDGSDAFFSADVAAKSFTSLGDASFRGSGNEFAAGSVTLLAGGVSDPIMSPNVSSIYDITQFPGADGSVRGITSDGTTWYRTVNRSGTSLGDRIERLNASGAVLSSFAINVDPLYGVTYLNGELYVYGKDHDRPDSEAYISVYGTDGIFKRQWKVLDFVPVVGFDGITRYPAIGITDTGLIAVIQARTTSGVNELEYYNPNGSFNSSVSLDGLSFSGDVIFAGVVVLGDRIYAANRNGLVQAWNGAGIQFTDLYWEAPDNEDINGFGLIGNSLYSYSNANRLVKYTNIELSIYDTYEAAYTWVDSTTGAETVASPRTSFQVLGRAKLKVSTTAIPIEASGVRFYLGPANGALHLIGETTTSSTLILDTLPLGWETAAGPPATNSFPSSTAALLASANGVFAVDGQGEGQWGQLQVDPTGTIHINANANEALSFGAANGRTIMRNPAGADFTFSNIGGGYSDVAFNEADVYGGRVQFMNNLPGYTEVYIQAPGEIFFTKINSTALTGVRMERIVSDYTYNRTTGSSANVQISSAGIFQRSTSLEADKIAINRDWGDAESWKSVKNLRATTFYDKANAERYVSLVEGGDSFEAEYPIELLGFIAEDVKEVMPILNTYNDQGEIQGVAYDRVSAAHQPWLLEHEAKIANLETEIAELKALIRRKP